MNSPPCELGASVGIASGLVQLLWTDTSLARSFGRTRANTYHTQSASERKDVGGSDRGSSVGPVRVSLQPLDSARAGKTVGSCTIYELWRCMPIQHRVTTSTSLCPALDHRSLLYYPLVSSQSTCIYPACSFLTRTYIPLYGIRTFTHPLFSHFIRHRSHYHSHAFRLELICPYIRLVPSCLFIDPSLACSPLGAFVSFHISRCTSCPVYSLSHASNH